ncbi:Warthog protein 4 [Toxocara canis]|uniref:Warthog protein 4 n=1 Tax=Toxocara canis TaxID=6265 RepID=A0A0B2VQJ3_TOXCA|nr:Warthog protein 4 [Toxocara canis]
MTRRWKLPLGRNSILLVASVLLVASFLCWNAIIIVLKKSTEKRTIPAECMCQFGGKEYDFCYRLPENLSVRGKRMSCASAPILHDLGLLQEDSNEYLDLRRDKMPQPVMVTAFSENHWEEGKRLISTIQRLWPQQLLIVYDLGLDESTARFVRKLCNVEYRKFDYMRYPPYVRRLSHYRWKPILIAETLDQFGSIWYMDTSIVMDKSNLEHIYDLETLDQFGSIWYMDTSIVMDKSNLEHIYDLVRCKRNHTAAPPLASIAERDERELSVPHESGWDQKQWRENIRECRKSSYLLHGYTGHGIFPATHPDTYVYIPTNLHEIKKPKAKMYDAGFVFAVKTTETIQNISALLMIRAVVLFVCCIWLRNCFASFCGESSVPFSVEVLSNGLPILGCARPLCFGWNPNGTVLSKNGVFYKMGGYIDGYVRKSVVPKMTVPTDKSLSFRPEAAHCEDSFGSRSCSVENEWLGGIAPVSNTNSVALRCCTYERLRLSTDRGTATVVGGQMAIGGEVLNGRRQYAFDYISNIEKHITSNGSVSYDVQMRRMNCLPFPTEQLLNVNAKTMEDIVQLLAGALALQKKGSKGERALAFQAPVISGGNEQKTSPHAKIDGLVIAQSQASRNPLQTNSYGASQEQLQKAYGIRNVETFLDQGLASRVGPPPRIVGSHQGQPVYELGGAGEVGNGFLCFSGDTMVETSDGRMVRMDELKLSDWVLSVKNRKVAYTTLVTWGHRIPSQLAEFVNISLEDGTSLKLTRKHFIYKTHCSDGNDIANAASLMEEAVYAEEVNEGDCVYKLSKNREALHRSKVVSVSSVLERGIYAPMTATGDIIVNGVLASCYNMVRSHVLQDTFFSIVYIVNEVSKWIFGVNEQSDSLVDLPLHMGVIAEIINSALPPST